VTDDVMTPKIFEAQYLGNMVGVNGAQIGNHPLRVLGNVTDDVM